MKKKRGFFQKKWDLAFVKGGMDTLFKDGEIEVEVVKNDLRQLLLLLYV